MARMKKMRVPPLAVSILLNGLISSATTVSAKSLFERANSAQCAPNFDPCPQTAELSWPDNFCCPHGSTCKTLAGNTTLLCCPPGFGCEAITTTGCQMDLYDADLHPDSLIKTTALNGVLDHCGNGTCCPFGYSCGTSDKGEPQCVKIKNQNPVPITTTPANPSTTSGSSSSTTTTTTQTTATQTTSIPTSPTSSPTTTTTPGQNNGASSGADSTTTPTAEPAESNNKGASTAVIAGTAVGAAILVAALAFLAFLFFRRRRHRKQQREEDEQAGDEALKLSRSTSSFGNIISNPIVAAGATMRSDFVLRKSPGGGNGGGGQRSSVGSAVSTLVGGEGGEPKTPSPSRSRMREGVGTTPTARIKPIRNMAAQARQSSIAYGVGGPGETGPYGGGGGGNYHADDGRLPYPQTSPRRDGGGGGARDQPREPSSVSINVFADPRIATPQRNDNAGGGGSGPGGLRVPETPEIGGGSRAMSMMTTFSDMLRSADLGGVAKGEPYVPGSNQGTPASRRR
ncbi:hypothetical protein GE09DRAFT_447969 [Coniochaeta sp. 2T2.1]|nr:hypothetical protein GE09DRAFT_447969 [Coniochaeta sp. 2T2.1]